MSARPKNPFLRPQIARNQDPTHETGLEKTLRLALERTTVCFERQKRLGRFTVDIYLPAWRAVIEADGSRWHPLPEQAHRSSWSAGKVEKARQRDAWLTEQGFRVFHLRDGPLRRNPDGCVQDILRELTEGMCPSSAPAVSE